MIEQLRSGLSAALQALGLESGPVQLDRPKDLQFGDLATNVPLVFAKPARQPPMALAEQLLEHLELDPGIFAGAHVTKPGFINFTLNDTYLQDHVWQIIAAGEQYGRSDACQGQRALVEFVSANPTGPLTVGHGRGAILGDTVSNILAWNGYQVEREYYYNDAGRQMRILGQSVWARHSQSIDPSAPFPEDGYEGEYITEISQSLPPSFNPPIPSTGETKPYEDPNIYGLASDYAEEIIFKEIENTLQSLGISFDHHFNEHNLYKSGAVDTVINSLRDKGYIYDRDGATWLKTTQLGRPDDRVLIKSTGEPTYRLPDIAYHADKLDRGFDLLVDIFGADHKETYPDVLAALRGMGYDSERIRVLIHQFVTFTRSGVKVKMSTRKAEYVTLDELVDEVGRDVVRYFFLMRSMDSHLNFDIDLAKQQSDENPVYYLQYAHARM
ncbi:MAG: arginine--tRNA ligase, partial [Candidatus Neomarinimicrobiota bacterium]